ncbi:MAG: Holliday junction branch migration protein RuvA [Helicobacter sp.]|nr:Holliday junction branch migration protein RuvA [Helicobacter sp.]
MFYAIKGEIYALDPMKLLLENGGIIYEINITLKTFNALKSSQNAFVFLSQIIREDSHKLVGFCDELERDMFLKLLKVSGIGVKVALAILSTFSAQEFIQIIQGKNITQLQRVPGVGAKSASKIILELSGILVQESSQNNLAKEALLNLGFKPAQIDKALKELDQSLSTPDLIKRALQIL